MHFWNREPFQQRLVKFLWFTGLILLLIQSKVYILVVHYLVFTFNRYVLRRINNKTNVFEKFGVAKINNWTFSCDWGKMDLFCKFCERKIKQIKLSLIWGNIDFLCIFFEQKPSWKHIYLHKMKMILKYFLFYSVITCFCFFFLHIIKEWIFDSSCVFVDCNTFFIHLINYLFTILFVFSFIVRELF